MSAQPATVTPINTEAGIFNEAIIQGKVNEISQPDNGDYNYFEIGLKASDEYSMPAVLQVSQLASQRPFAKKGEIVTIRVQVGGYPRKTQGGTRIVTNTLTYLETL